MTLTFPIRKMLFMIRPVAIAEALQNPLPVIAIWMASPQEYTLAKITKENITRKQQQYV